jgi:DNA-binding ferritin-like protein
MGLLSKFSTLFGAKPSGSSSASSSQSAFRPAIQTPRTPVEIDISSDDDFAIDDEPRDDIRRAPAPLAAAAPPKSKSEMLAELQKNYSEVMELIRKVSNHLDEQNDRSIRLMEIAERIPEALDTLPELRDQNTEIIAALKNAADDTRARDERAAQSLDLLADRLEEGRESDRVLVGTMAEFRGTLREMADTSEKTGVTLSDMNQRNMAREQELHNILQLTRRWITIATVVGVVLVMVATAAVIMIAARG